MNGTLGIGNCEGCGHVRVSVCLYNLAEIVNFRPRASKRGEKSIRNRDYGALALLEGGI